MQRAALAAVLLADAGSAPLAPTAPACARRPLRASHGSSSRTSAAPRTRAGRSGPLTGHARDGLASLPISIVVPVPALASLAVHTGLAGRLRQRRTRSSAMQSAHAGPARRPRNAGLASRPHRPPSASAQASPVSHASAGPACRPCRAPAPASLAVRVGRALALVAACSPEREGDWNTREDRRGTDNKRKVQYIYYVKTLPIV
jgi:hypothetical protein